MKLLGLRLCDHDSNITITNGKSINYYKTERHYHIKHHGYSNSSFIDFVNFIKEKDIDLSNIDEAAIVVDDKNEEQIPLLTDFLGLKCKIYKVDHHLAHALSVWPMHKTDDIKTDFVLDGFGDYDIHHSIYHNKKLFKNYNLKQHYSLGLAFSKIGSDLNLKGNGLDFAGKLMALKSFYLRDEKFINFLKTIDFLDVNEMFSLKNWVKHKKSVFVADNTFTEWFANIHFYLENEIVNYFDKYVDSDETFSYTGGVAQNICFNEKLKNKFKNMIIPPHGNDEGLSLGCVEWLRQKNNLDYFSNEGFPYWQTDEQPTSKPDKQIIKKTAELLAKGKIIGWYQGKGEIGPRALGNRSILMNPTIKYGANYLNNNVKFREDFRPFGASVLEEKSKDYFDIENSKYMLYSCDVKDKELLKNVTHIDGTCRPQTVGSENEIYRELIEEFEKLTGLPILLNTSLNVQGEPICGSINKAKIVLNNTKLDHLVVGNEFY